MPALSGGVRETTATHTVAVAGPVARSLGVTRCAEVTRLDRIGIPIYSAVRPRARFVRVTAGKGRAPDEAHAGALMEAIEQAVAESSLPSADILRRSPADVAADGGPRVGELCPRIGRRIDVETPISWVIGRDHATGVPLPVPVELVFLPCPPEHATGMFAATTTTGLASGNTETEAVLHGLCEVIERDITTFCDLDDMPSVAVDAASLPPGAAAMVEAITAAGLGMWINAAPTGPIPYFSCLIVDDDATPPLSCTGGYGCHPVPEIAVSRAITEAAQSRLGWIQGARDDLVDLAAAAMKTSTTPTGDRRRAALIARHGQGRLVSFADIPGDAPAPVTRLLDCAVRRCVRAGFDRVIIYRYPGGLADPLHVVRVIVPGAEHFTDRTRRVGPRLAAHARKARPAPKRRR